MTRKPYEPPRIIRSEPLSDRDMILFAAEPPKLCPWCADACTSPARDASGRWTWSCSNGCNP